MCKDDKGVKLGNSPWGQRRRQLGERLDLFYGPPARTKDITELPPSTSKYDGILLTTHCLDEPPGLTSTTIDAVLFGSWGGGVVNVWLSFIYQSFEAHTDNKSVRF